MSKLYFRYGAMNSGKSTALMQVAHNYEERNMKVLVIKPKIDTKGDNLLISRLNLKRSVDVLVKENDNLLELNLENIKCILVDEAQFLSKEHIDQLFEIAVLKKIPVICYGIRCDFLMDGFEGSTRLLQIAHSLEEVKTICRCGKKAMVNARKINGNFVFEGERIAIDGSGNIEYESLCPECYLNFKNQIT